MNAMKNKIKSQRGASITFALLIFLVCAVISSVVIVAATAAAGRMSQQGEMDERYYAVTASAKRLNDVFAGKEVAVTYEIKDGSPDFSGATVTYADGSTTPTIPTILQKASIDVVQGVLWKDKDNIIEPGSISIEDTDSNTTCTVTRSMMDDGRMEYTISAQKTKDASNSGQYKVFISFSPNLPSVATKMPDGKEKIIVKWKLLGVEKNRPMAKPTAAAIGG